MWADFASDGQDDDEQPKLSVRSVSVLSTLRAVDFTAPAHRLLWARATQHAEYLDQSSADVVLFGYGIAAATVNDEFVLCHTAGFAKGELYLARQPSSVLHRSLGDESRTVMTALAKI